MSAIEAWLRMPMERVDGLLIIGIVLVLISILRD